MFSARLLTQWLRLPVPGLEQIDAGAPKLEEFEKASVGHQFRLPVVSSQKTVVGGGLSDPPTTNDPLIQEGYNFYMGHFYMFARLQRHWMSLDAYCRVCMVLGCNQILNVVVYTGLAWFTLLDHQWGVIAFVLIPVVFSVIHAQINLLLSRRESLIFLSALCLGPLLASVAACVQMVYTNEGSLNQFGAQIAQAIALGSYLFHFISSLFFVYLGSVDVRNGLPARFTTVNYIDVLGLNEDLKPAKGLSGKLSGILSSALQSDGTVTDRKQPPMKEVVPAAGSLVRAESMYLSLVEKKRANAIDQTDSTPVLLIESRGHAFATQHNDNRKSIRLANSFIIERKQHKDRENDIIVGPKDYAPTPAQLHAPDMLGRTPALAFKYVGLTIVGLWLAGIFFGSISLSQTYDIGWINTSVSSSTNSTRRLLDQSETHYPPVAKFFQASSAICLESGAIRFTDSMSNRIYVQMPDGSTVNCLDSAASVCDETGRSADYLSNFVEISPRIYSIRVSQNSNTTVTVPLIHHTHLFRNPRFLINLDTIIGLGDAGSDSFLIWNLYSGAFITSLTSPCKTPHERQIISVCPISPYAVFVAFKAGDSCSLHFS